jgi:AraC-like DNA-binding protein/quercetin dioxygenase-like cupin family protein
VSLNGQGLPGSSDASVIVCDFPMTRDVRFTWHSHDEHQLAWAASGVLVVECDAGRYVLPPTRALWIPAQTPHETSAGGVATMRSAYLRIEGCPIDWAEPTPVAVSPLLAELISYLDGEEAVDAPRQRAEQLLYDLLEPVPTAAVEVPIPTEPRAHDVAAGLMDDPRDARTLAEWGHMVGASERSLARAFVASTGLTFGTWRTRARLQAALPLLAAGRPVSTVAGEVGYETPSAFVAAFRRETGVTPGRYFAT